MNHHVHLPHLVPHLDGHHLARDAVLFGAAAVASFGVLELAMSDRTAPVTTFEEAPAVATSDIPVLAVDHADGLIEVTFTDTEVMAGATRRADLVDAQGNVLASADLSTAGPVVIDAPEGDFTVVVTSVGPVVTDGDTGLSAATAVRSDPVTATAGEQISIVDASG
ncbi:MAG: hypothetical protein S0880_34775 [Actinomycetota bacterium]|nr:hypothetical protein [Actinomycetota bacterium]